MPWAPLMMLPDRGQLYDAMAQAYDPQPQYDPNAYSAALAGVDAGALAPVAPPQQTGVMPRSGEPYWQYYPEEYMYMPPEPYVPGDTQRLLDENEALLRAIYSNANL